MNNSKQEIVPSVQGMRNGLERAMSGLGQFTPDLKVETTTIMFADVVESVRLIEQDETLSVVRIRTLLKQVAENIVPEYGGQVLERRGDGLLVRFESPHEAVRCAVKMHAQCERASRGFASEQVIALRIGIHRSDVISDQSAIYGQGINLAARLAALAGPGETVLSMTARDELTSGINFELEDIGDCYLKHVPEPVRVFRLGAVGPTPVLPDGHVTPEDELPSIAVLPFESRGGDEADTASDLLGETLTHCLARSGALKVLAWMSCKSVARSGLGAKAEGEALRAQWVVTGSCHVVGGKLLVNAQLVKVATEHVVHSERVVDSLSDLLEPESEIAGQLAHAIVRAVTSAEAQRVSRHALPTLSGHTLLLGGIGLIHRSGPAEFLRGRDALEHLLERQPRMHSARPWLAKWYVLRTTRGMVAPDPKEAGKALDQTSRALDSLHDDAFALAIQGFVFFHMLKDVARAHERLTQAVTINPNEPLAAVFNAALVNARGDFQAAWDLARKALTLSPFDPMRPYMRMIAAACAMTSAHYSEAVDLARLSLKENAAHPATWRTLVIGLVQSGRVEEARQAALQLLRVEPDLTVKAYEARTVLPPDVKAWAVEAMRVAGIPAG